MTGCCKSFLPQSDLMCLPWLLYLIPPACASGSVRRDVVILDVYTHYTGLAAGGYTPSLTEGTTGRCSGKEGLQSREGGQKGNGPAW
jgi:hypothetical protein